MSERTRKIESQLKEIVGEGVDSLSDPRLKGMVTVTAVRVSPDLARATVFYSLLSGGEPGEVHDGLRSAAGRMQAAIGRQTRLKRTPKLDFEPDPVMERAGRIEAALRDIKGTGGTDAD